MLSSLPFYVLFAATLEIVLVRLSEVDIVMREGTAHQVDRIGILPPVDRHHRTTARALSLPRQRLDHIWAAHFTTAQCPDHT